MLPLLIKMTTNQHQVMFSWWQGEQLPGNPRSRPWSSSQQLKLNMLPYLRLGKKHVGSKICLKNLLGYPQEFPIIIKGDNDSSIAMAKNQQFHSQMQAHCNLMALGLRTHPTGTGNHQELLRSSTNSWCSYKSSSIPKASPTYIWHGPCINLRGSIRRQADTIRYH